MIWHNCKLVFNALTGKETPPEASDTYPPQAPLMYSEYKENMSLLTAGYGVNDIVDYWAQFYKDDDIFDIHRKEYYNVWYDYEQKIYFSAIAELLSKKFLQDFDVDSIDELQDRHGFLNPSVFLDFPNKFVNNPKFGVHTNVKKFKKYLEFDDANIKFNTELIWEDNKNMAKYKNKKILIIGAGPSADMVDYDKLDYDYAWSCNHFFNHDKISKLDLDLVYLSNDSYHKQEAIDYVTSSDKIMLAFDFSVNRDPDLLLSWKRNLPGRTFLYSTRLFTKRTGIMPRLISLAVMFGAKEIMFAGMDGQTLDDYTTGFSRSIFEEGKRIPSHQTPHPLKWHRHRREHVLIWDYLLFRLPKMMGYGDYQSPKYRNLGENYKHNMTADISKKIFPLE